MARRKDRVPVVLDTNVIVSALLSTRRQSVNQQIVHLWLHRHVQLIVSEEVASEYLELIERLLRSQGRNWHLDLAEVAQAQRAVAIRRSR